MLVRGACICPRYAVLGRLKLESRTNARNNTACGQHSQRGETKQKQRKAHADQGSNDLPRTVSTEDKDGQYRERRCRGMQRAGIFTAQSNLGSRETNWMLVETRCWRCSRPQQRVKRGKMGALRSSVGPPRRSTADALADGGRDRRRPRAGASGMPACCQMTSGVMSAELRGGHDYWSEKSGEWYGGSLATCQSG